MPPDFLYPLHDEIVANVRAALAEDVGSGDLTAQLLAAEQSGRARLISREAAILCGRAWFDECFAQLDARYGTHTTIDWQVEEGGKLLPDQRICELSGNARTLLTGERSAMNFLQLLSGVATKTRHYADLIAGTAAQVVDTRKTLPGLRLAQKYAVRAGGGGNHRLALWDAILIKENHILAAGSIAAAIAAAEDIARAAGERCRFVQVEVENLAETQAALEAGAKMLLLDNFSLDMLRQAVALNQERAVLEASGGISEATLRPIAETGVDRVSVGALTKDVRAIDLSMRFVAAC
ncbi:nicotinate-nucleotide pyrophosphorylase [carboxylating] [Betaproteobacteria bacterium]|nr:nicotinate-nucleotide pyrophosphorylase [carboxylating] [Betaproteobacteria bacterium]GHU46636.1 nicotinate-nucleotide pyrophosphorylase [carboxylating] [Betaproteobacteria bacterium]